MPSVNALILKDEPFKLPLTCHPYILFEFTIFKNMPDSPHVLSSTPFVKPNPICLVDEFVLCSPKNLKSPIVNPATTRNPYIVLFGFVSVAERLGLKNIRVIKISKSSYGAAVYAGNSLKSFFTFVVDANNMSDFIFSHTYFDEYKSNPVQTLIASKTLSFGASNNQGSQEIGNSSGQVIFYLISFD